LGVAFYFNILQGHLPEIITRGYPFYTGGHETEIIDSRFKNSSC